MAKSQWRATNGTGMAVNDNQTVYFPLVGALLSTTVEAESQIPVYEPGTIRKWRIRVLANTATVTSVFTIMVDGSASAVTFNVTADGTGYFADLANSVHLTSGQLICGKLVVPTETGTNTITVTHSEFEFEPDDPTKTVVKWVNNGNSPGLTAGPRYMVPNGYNQYSATEAPTKGRIRNTCTAGHLWIYVVSNARADSSTVMRTRKDGANGGGIVTVTASATGVFHDASGTDSLVDGSDFNFEWTLGAGAQSLVMRTCCVEVVSTDSTIRYFCGNSSGTAQGPSTTKYYGLGGMTFLQAAADVDVSATLPAGMTITGLQAMIAANTGTVTPATYTVTKNGSATGLVLSVGTIAAATLVSESSPTSVAFAADDVLGIEAVNADAAGSITPIWIAVLATVAAAATGHPAGRRLGLCENIRPVEIGRQNVRVF